MCMLLKLAIKQSRSLIKISNVRSQSIKNNRKEKHQHRNKREHEDHNNFSKSKKVAVSCRTNKIQEEDTFQTYKF